MTLPVVPARDAKLVQIVDAALADVAIRSGGFLVCRPGCTQCCTAVFAVNQLDAARLRQGLADLEAIDSGRAAAIRDRARIAIQRMAAQFPGDANSGILDERVFHAGSKAAARFEQFGNDEVCPVLNSNTGRCELYNSRPMTCRTFGPPVRSEDGLGVCELCFHGATDEQIADCEMVADPEDLEADVLRELERETDARGRTIVAYCIR